MSIQQEQLREEFDYSFIASGLSQSQIEINRRLHGSNELTPPPRRPLFLLFLEKFKDQTIILLCICAVIAIVLGIVESHFPFDGIGILVAVLIATGVAFFSEYKSDKAFEVLKAEASRSRVKVRRDGQPVVVGIEEVVVGDVLLLEKGNKVPADAVIFSDNNLTVNRAAMTGESLAVTLKTGDMLERGTLVETGRAIAVVRAVGDETKLGKINRELGSEEDERTPLQEQLGEVADTISKFGTIAAILIFFAQIFRAILLTALGSDIGYTLGFNTETLSSLVQFVTVSIAIVVVAVPEGLPLAVTVSLSLSAQRITKDNNLVRKLVAVETMGATTVICSDKTGTLTQNRLAVSSLYWNGSVYEETGLKQFNRDPAWPLLELNIALNTTADLIEKAGATEFIVNGDQLEGALLHWMAQQTGQPKDYLKLRAVHPPVQSFEFDSNIKLMTTVVANPLGEGWLVLVKGAPERVWALCDTIVIDGQVRPQNEYLPDMRQQVAEMSQRGLRNVAMAYRFISPAEFNKADRKSFESNLTMLAVFGFIDPLRPEVVQAVSECRRAGVTIKMLTGDNQLTAQTIARQLNMLEDDHICMTSEDFNRYSDEALRELLPRLAVLARSTPQDKSRLVRLLMEEYNGRREVVAVTGDGTNDAAALKKADVGIAMGVRGTEVAKEASDIILLDDNFKSIVRAINWGRGLYENIQKFLQFQLTVNITALSLVFIGTLLGFTLPLTPIQLLWVNLIMDTLAVVALSLDPPRPGLMNNRPRGRGESIITQTMWFSIIFMSVYFTVVMLGLLWLFNDGGINRQELTVIFGVFVLLQLFNEINSRSLDPRVSPLAGIWRSKSFMGVFLATLLVQLFLTQTGGPVGEFFRTTPLDWTSWLLIIGFGSVTLLIGEINRLVRKARFKQG